MNKRVSILTTALILTMTATALGVNHSKIGEKIKTEGGDIEITTIDQRRGYGSGPTYDSDINSPKSATVTHDGKKV